MRTLCLPSRAATHPLGRQPSGRSRLSTRLGVRCCSGPEPVTIDAQVISAENFAPFGQLVEPIDDMKAFDEEDAQLNLSKGTPRFYIMRLPAKPEGLSFTQITHHKDVTQCLGSLTPDAWYMAVAEAGAEDLEASDVKVFKVPFGVFIKMHEGTWHAGPHFTGHDHMDFYNLELADTNQVDHFNHYFDQSNGCVITIAPC